MIQALAIDDEINALGIITEFTKRIPDVELMQTFTDPTKGLQYLLTNKIKPDILFLDIQMSRLNGLSLANQLPENIRIILTTAFPDFALQGYELNVIDYLLKPFSFERFERAIQKARNILPDRNGATASASRLSPLNDDFIFVKTDHKTIRVKLADILYIEGSGNYVTLHTLKGKVLVLQNLKTFEEQLLPYQFIRIHKSYVISLTHIESIEKGNVTIGSHELPIGDSYKEQFTVFLANNFRQF